MKFSVPVSPLAFSLVLLAPGGIAPIAGATAPVPPPSPPATAAAAPAADPVVDYPEAWMPELARILDQARAQAPQLIVKGIEQEESVARLQQAKAAYYPRLGLIANLGYRKEYRSEGDDVDNLGLNFNLALRRPIYHWGSIEARIRQARLDYKNEELERILTLRRIHRSIRADYLSLLVNQAALRNARLRRQIFEERAATLRTSLEAGNLSTVEAEQNTLNLNEAIMNIEQLEAGQERILASFKRNIGWQSPLALSTPLPPLPTDDILRWVSSRHDETGDTWIEDTGEARKRRNLIEREKAELVRINAAQRPLLNFATSVGYGQANTADRDNVDTTTWFIGVDVNWNIFDGFETSQRKRESNLRRRRMETQFNAWEAELRAQSDAVLDDLSFQARRLALQQRRYQLAGDAWTRDQRDHAEGRLAATAFRDRQLAVYESELNILQARAALIMGVTDYLDLTAPGLRDTLTAATSGNRAGQLAAPVTR
ncbi:outer membrane protein [Opitutaceae bacterium TAV1]|nr:outer membrane protein [Opitutaceae bacterium TAV1]